MLKQLLTILLAAPLVIACGGNAPKKEPPKGTSSAEGMPADDFTETPEAPEITGKVYKAVYRSDDMESQAIYNLPVVDDAFPKLKAALSDRALLGAPIDEVMNDYREGGYGTTSADFKITYITPELVSLIVTTEFMGAYPSGADEFKTLDVETGKPYVLSREVNAKGVAWILETYKKVVLARVRDSESEYDGEESFTEIRENLEGLSAEDLEGHFVFTAKGLRVTSDDVMPHVAQALEPDRVVDFSYDALKKYAAPTSVIFKKK